jgi:hypothetical protein
MISDLLDKYTPEERGLVNQYEYQTIESSLCLNEMDILQLRNLRDFTVAYIGRSDSLVDWDRMSAIVDVIDNYIVKLGGEV